MWTARYRAVPSKIDRRRSISAVSGRLKKKKKGRKNTSPARCPRPLAVLARSLSSPARCPRPPAAADRLRAVATRGLPARRHYPWVARGRGHNRFFSRARRQIEATKEIYLLSVLPIVVNCKLSRKYSSNIFVFQSDYLRKISLKMLSMESKSQHSASINPSMSNSTITNQNPADSGIFLQKLS
ncbi:hypothetical protein GW17_00002041 [Ensete ventricosum]|nr:hypothetical protein GW17_00002041 [Ensete ventricosum]